MKHKIGWIALSVIIVIASIGAYYVFSQKENQFNDLSGQYSEISKELNQRDSVVNEMVYAFDEIESNLDSIIMKRTELALMEKEGNTNQKQRIVDGIKQLDVLLEQSSQQIAQLESKLKKSGIEVGSFKTKLTLLTENIEKQNLQISELKEEIENRDFTIMAMNQKMVVMEDEIMVAKDSIELQKKTIKEKEDQMNTAYIAFGTYDELKEKGLLIKEGGFLNIGGTKTINKDFNQEYYVKLDKRETNEIPIHSKKARIISEHPDSSYHFVEEDGLITALAIENPSEFWKISKYALIEIK